MDGVEEEQGDDLELSSNASKQTAKAKLIGGKKKNPNQGENEAPQKK